MKFTVSLAGGICLSALILFPLLNCSDNKPTTPTSPVNSNLLQNVVFEPDSGPPGTAVKLLHLPQLSSDASWSMDIGDVTVPVMSLDSGYYTVIPLIFSPSDSSWPVASAAPLDVILFRDSTPVDTAFGKITVDSLAHADGAADSLIQDFSNAATAMREISLSLGIEDTLLQAVCMAMDEIILTGDNSLSAIINGTSPIVDGEALPANLFSALLVSSGTADLISVWSDSLQTIQKAAARYRLPGAKTSFMDDEGLAYRMQMYSILSDFGSIAIGETAMTWNQVSAVLGGAGIAFPPLGTIEFIVSFVISELDFIFNKLALALLPAEITSFDLDFYNHELMTGDTTEAIIHISARNNPPNITPFDIVTQVINGMGLADWLNNLGPARRLIANNFHDIVLNLTTWFIGVVNNILGTYFNAPTMIDVSLPTITYDSVWIHHDELVDMISPDFSKVEPMTGSFNGRVKDSTGTIVLTMATQTPGPNTLIHPILAGLGYAGGAFGNEYYTSDPDTIKVVSNLVLNVSLTNPISQGGAGVLHADVGIKQTDGSITHKPGIDISVSVSGGTAETTSGQTDADGWFSTVITPAQNASFVEVTVVASDESGAIVSKSIVSDVSDHCMITSLEANVYFNVNIYYSLTLHCDVMQKQSCFKATVLNSHMAGTTAIPYQCVDSNSTFQYMHGRPQGWSGDLMIEITAESYWPYGGECSGQSDGIIDTVIVTIP